jgi:hypothetical protein
MKALRGRRLIVLTFNFDADLVGGQHQAPAFIPPGKKPGTHCTGGWVDSGAGLDK